MACSMPCERQELVVDDRRKWLKIPLSWGEQHRLRSGVAQVPQGKHCYPNSTSFRAKSRKQRARPDSRRKTLPDLSGDWRPAGFTQLFAERPGRQMGYLPFGREYFARLPYVENYYASADGTTGLTTVPYVFRGNSLYDPRFETGGHQPLQYDTLAALYERVWVDRADIEVTFSNPSADGVWVGLRCRNSTNSVATGLQSLDYIQELADSMIRPLNNTGTQTVVLRATVEGYKAMGISKAAFENLEYSHVVNTNPSAGWFIEPFVVNTIAGTEATIRINVKIIYHARFTNRVSAAQS